MGVQVQTATKNGKGESLPILNRQFISFSYGGKDIEDFDLLASFDGDRLSKNIYSSFQDVTSEQSELDGQQYWASSYKANELEFSLVTDGIDSKTLEEFKRWFIPGVERELILTEHHARGILARVSNAPQMSLLPFEKDIQVKVGNNIYSTKTSLYKGDIKLSFVMDDPFWYSREGCYKLNTNSSPTSDQLKAFYEDKIPFNKIINSNSKIFFGNNVGWNGTAIVNNLKVNFGGEDPIYFYYPGTAREKPKISFKVPLQMDNSYYVHFRGYDINNNGLYKIDIYDLPENNIRTLIQTLEFSEPSIITSYNSVVDFMYNNVDTGISILDLRAKVRDVIYDKYLLAWTMAVIDCLRNHSGYVNQTMGMVKDKESFLKGFFCAFKRFFFYSSSFIKESLENGEVMTGPAPVITIDSLTGKVSLDIIVLKLIEGQKLEIYLDFTTNIDNHQKGEDGKPVYDDKGNIIYTKVKRLSLTENAGNMIKSKYLIFEPVTVFIENTFSEKNCLELRPNIILEELKLNYKYKYL